MSGKILIVDAVATNRIVLKVKLAAAHFVVHQASSGGTALSMARDMRPDLIIIGTAPNDMERAELIGALRAHPALVTVPIVALLARDSGAARIDALRAGADDVFPHPIDERIMLARIRGLLRQHHALQDMRLNAEPDCAAGFGEAQGDLLRAGRITILSSQITDAMSLRTRLRNACGHQITVHQPGGPVTGSHGTPAADVFGLLVPPGCEDAGLEQMAELRASLDARHSRIMCLVPDGSHVLAANLLDLGASDAIVGPIELDELVLRLNRQIQRKHAIDHLRTRLHDGLRAAMIDPLTGLYNRRFAMPFLKELALGQGPQQRGFAVMVADLDHFKQINDSLGHAAGDRVLCHVADILSSSVREVDLVARIGGEEFLIIIPGSDGSEARRTADRLCLSIAKAGITLQRPDTTAHVTVSIGVAMGEPGATDESASAYVEMLLDQADQALYRAKACGRNMVTISARPAA